MVLSSSQACRPVKLQRRATTTVALRTAWARSIRRRNRDRRAIAWRLKREVYGLRRCAFSSPDDSWLSFEHMQHRESFGATPAKWPPCPSRCRRARRVRALCQGSFRLSRRSRRLPGSFETIDPTTALPMASNPYRLRAEPPQPRRTRAPRDGQNNGQPGVFRTGCREDELYNVAGTAHWRLLRDDAIAHAFGHELGVNKVMSYFTSPRFIKKGI